MTAQQCKHLRHSLTERCIRGCDDTEDDDPLNMLVRAGYLAALATRLEGQDRDFVLRASLERLQRLEELEAAMKPRSPDT